MPAPATPGRLLVTLVILTLTPGAFIADYNHTHLFNPRWPPHARFHNAQTMSMSIALTLPTLWYAWRGPRSSTRQSTGAPAAAAAAAAQADDLADSIVTATIFATIYPLTTLTAWFFPTVLAVDPEFGTGFPQFKIMTTGIAVAWAGCALELARVRGVKAKASGKGA
ncbi:hypothetical protein LTR84_007196 [Exophiala bonariae]|uniref:Uncharacterized protein n=1 Tax=Exophiala bonariae TaxID=1690606 RepID=A0AAV9MYQ5_9EURO|nr:hypothetical protein LTR84_007196 [Exophiala bonariae]